MTEDLSANEMVSYANAMSERIVELERENERLQSRVEALEEVAEAARNVLEYGDGSVIETNFQKLERALVKLRESEGE